MSSPSLERLDNISSYNSGIPNTTPPSFHSVSHSPYDLPHRNDESAATILPSGGGQIHSKRATRNLSVTEGDDGISLWGGTSSSAATSRDFNPARQDVIVQLIKRVEDLEARLYVQERSKMKTADVDIEALERRPRTEMTDADRDKGIAVAIGAFLFFASFWIFFLLVSRSKNSGV